MFVTDKVRRSVRFLPGIASYIASATLTFTDKTFNLANNTLIGTTAEFNAALSDNDFATLAGTETLTNKTVAYNDNVLTGVLPVVAGAAHQVINGNPGGLLDQELGGAGTSTNGGYGGDQWQLQKSGIAGTCTLTQGTETAVAGLTKRLRLAMPIEATGTNDFIIARNPIEGTFMRRLGWKGAGASGSGGVATIGVLLRSNVTGVKQVRVLRQDGGIAYVFSVSLTADTPAFVRVALPAPTANAAWLDSTSVAAYIDVIGRAGSGLISGTVDSWGGALTATSALTNNDASQENLDILFCGLMAGNVHIVQADVPYLIRDIPSEQVYCRRYYETHRMVLETTAMFRPWYWEVPKRTETPSLSLTPDSGTGATIALLGARNFYQNAGHSGVVGATAVANDRIA